MKLAVLLVGLLALTAVAAQPGGYGEAPAAGGYGASPGMDGTVLQCAHAVRCTCEAPPSTCVPVV